MLKDLQFLESAKLNLERLVASTEFIEHNSVILALIVIQVSFFNAFEPLAQLQSKDFKAITELDLLLALLRLFVGRLIAGV